MQLRKTRIQKITKANGTVKYFPQYKGLVFWYDFYGIDSAFGMWKIVSAWLKSNGEVDHTEKEAKDFIDFYIQQVKYIQACEVENKIVKVSYEGYPE